MVIREVFEAYKKEISAGQNFIIGFLAATVFFTSLILVSAKYARHNRISQSDKVQEGYIIPSKLEINVRDSDKNGFDEVYLNYDGREYLFKLDEKGNPRVQNYEIKPAEIVPKE